jgi:hypothetical protein
MTCWAAYYLAIYWSNMHELVFQNSRVCVCADYVYSYLYKLPTNTTGGLQWRYPRSSLTNNTSTISASHCSTLPSHSTCAHRYNLIEDIPPILLFFFHPILSINLSNRPITHYCNQWLLAPIPSSPVLHEPLHLNHLDPSLPIADSTPLMGGDITTRTNHPPLHRSRLPSKRPLYVY